MPSAGAATVGEPSEGVCSLKVNDPERKFIDSLDRSVGIGAVEERTRWASAFEQLYPTAADTVAPFLELYTGSYVTYFNSNLEANIEMWAQRVAENTGADIDSSRAYFTQVWNSAAVSDHQAFDMTKYWDIVNNAVQSGEITVPTRDGFAEFALIPDRDELIEQQSRDYPAMPKDQVEAWVDAYEQLPDMKQARRVARLMVAFEEARKTCAEGGGNATLPTDGPNPDAPTTTPTTSTSEVPSGQAGRSRDTVTHTLVNGNVTATVTTDKMTSLTVSQTTHRTEPTADTTSGGSSASTGAIIGVIVAILVALGAAGAAFALSDQQS
ncbi:hypothetical protein MHJ86_07230 [Corynebacterium afermentans]|nr:hypothetical protein [Corynebacterium afermentans]